MNLVEMQSDLEQILRDVAVPVGHETGRASLYRSMPSAREIARVLAAPGVRGWVTTAGANWYRTSEAGWRPVSRDNEGPAPTDEAAVPDLLWGEIALLSTGSLHLRRLRGELRVWRITESGGPDSGEEEVESADVLWRSVRRASTAPRTKSLDYRVAWRLENVEHGGVVAPVLRPWLARFVGWEEGR